MRMVDQLLQSSSLLTDFGANFSKKVRVFLIDILGFFAFWFQARFLGVSLN